MGTLTRATGHGAVGTPETTASYPAAFAPTSVSLMVGDLSRKGILERREDEGDRRRRIVSITDARQAAIGAWLARGATAWQDALNPLTPPSDCSRWPSPCA
jgi:hypothetical protein